MDGEEQQTTISPEFLENIQSAVNSQGVLGQVQVIETENGPVTVLFMEEGADTSNLGGDNITLTVTDGNLANTVDESNVQFQYQVQADEDYTKFLQSGAVEPVTAPETVKEDVVASVEPVIGLTEQASAENLGQKESESGHTFFITETGEVLKIDSALLGDNADTTLQLQTQDGSYQILNQLGSAQTSLSNSQPTVGNMNITYEDSTSAPLEYTATKIDNPLVIDTTRVEEPKVLSYKTTNRQRTNIMRQPVSKPSPAHIQSKPVLTNQTVKTQTSLLSQSQYRTVKQVDQSGNTTEIVYPKSYQKQTVVFPKVQKHSQFSSVAKTGQHSFQPQQMITTVMKPQSLLKSSADQSLLKPAVSKINASQTTGSTLTQSIYTKKLEQGKYIPSVISKNVPTISKQQTDLLSVAMKQAEVPAQISSSVPAVQKKVVVPTVVRDSVPVHSQADKPVVDTPIVKENLQDKSVGEEKLASVSKASEILAREKQVTEIPQAVPVSSAEAPALTEMVSQETQSAVENADSQTDDLGASEMEEQQHTEDDQHLAVQKADGWTEDKTDVSKSDTAEQTSETTVRENDKDEKTQEVTGDSTGEATHNLPLPTGEMKSIDVPDSDVTIQLFADGTLVTRDKAGTNYSQVKLEDLGLDLSMLEGNTDIELLIVQGDGKEVRATINTSKDVNPTTESVTQVSKTAPTTTVAKNADQSSKETTSITKSQEATAPINEARPYKCSMCPRTFKFYRTFRCHEIVHTKAVTFTCHLCQRLFAREVNLQSHLELHKKKGAMRPTQESIDIKSRQCPHCKKIYGDVQKLQRHIKEHEQKKVPCPICGKLFTNETNVMRHSRIHSPPYTCPHCVKVFTDGMEYSEHIKSEHADLMFCCKECNAILPSKKAFVSHTVSQHSNAEKLLEGIKEKECPICDRKFEKLSALESHMAIHSGEKNHECPACPKKYKYLPRLEQHIKDEHNNDVVFTCSECEEQFSLKGKLDLHIKLYHDGNYQCLTCYEEFPERLQLEEHQFKNHDICFTCSKCKSKFETSVKLKHHLEEHTSQNNLCDICGTGFEHKSQLKSHLIDEHFSRDRTSMLKQYPSMAKVNAGLVCDLCGEFWPSKPLYKQHLRDTHFGGDTVAMLAYFPYFEKVSDPPEPATCDHCGKLCASVTQLNFHLKSHLKSKEKGKVREEFNSTDDEQDDEVDLSNIEPREMDKNYSCMKCDAEFSRKAALQKHIKTIHQKDEFKEALRELEKEEIARAELEEKEGIKSTTKTKKSASALSSDKKTKVTTIVNQTPNSKKTKFPYPKLLVKNKSNTDDVKLLQKKKSSQLLICKICEEVFKSSQELVVHMQDDHGEIDFKEDDIAESSSTKKDNEAVKFDLTTFQCLSCNKGFTCRKNLRKHLNRVHKYRRDQYFENRQVNELKTAKSQSKKRERKGKLDEFDFEPMEESVDEHLEDSTTDITAFLGKNFNLGKAHSCNIESVKKKQHRCNLCGEGFSREATLKKHIALHDAGEDLKPEFEDISDLQPAIYPCSTCGNMYSTALGLIHHNRSKHSEVDEETVLSQISQVDEMLKLESPKKKVEKDYSKSVKRKLETDADESRETAKKRIKIDKDGKDVFDCKFCGAVYYTFKGIMKHEREFHSGDKEESQQSPVKYSHSGRLITKSKKLIEQIQCDRCSKTFLEEKNLKLHIQRVHKVDGFEKMSTESTAVSSFDCNLCPKKFGLRVNLGRHMKMKHNIELPPEPTGASADDISGKRKLLVYHCDVCGQKFSTLSSLQHHLTSVHDEIDENLADVKTEPVSCTVCEHEFATAKSLEVHMRKHTGEKPYKCCLCNKQFISKNQLECHMKKLHTKLFAKKVKCKICLMLFETEKAMLKHKVIHKKLVSDEEKDQKSEPSLHKCNHCSKAFKWKRNLVSHVETYHKDSDPQTCGLCNKVFPDMASVKAHMTEHQTPPLSYTCKICEKSFPGETNLKMHESHMHKPKTSPNGMSCDICKESFQTKIKLLEHMLTHTSVMPHKCDLCSASFKQEFRLKAHKLTHKLKKKKTEMKDIEDSNGEQSIKEEDKSITDRKEVSNKKYKCKKCSKHFNKLWLLKSHISKSHKPKLSLKVAFQKSKVTTRSRSSSSEIRPGPEKKGLPLKKTKLKAKKTTEKVVKKTEKTVFCKKCNLNFIKIESYQKHLRTVHQKVKKDEGDHISKKQEKRKLKTGGKASKAKKLDKPASKKETEQRKGKKETVGHDCPICKKMFSKEFRLRNHIKNVHQYQMEEPPIHVESKRRKCLYCTDCARVFWSRLQYDTHNKRFHPDRSALELDKQVMQAMSGDIKTEPEDSLSSPKQLEFETVQHKCEFCSKVHWTKKLFDEHILKEHPEHAHEYGISGDEDLSRPTIELVNDSEDLMGNLLSVELYDVSACDKLSSLPVVSIQRINSKFDGLVSSSSQQLTDVQADDEMEDYDTTLDVVDGVSTDVKMNELVNKTGNESEISVPFEKREGLSDVGCVISSVETLQAKDDGDTEDISQEIPNEKNIVDPSTDKGMSSEITHHLGNQTAPSDFSVNDENTDSEGKGTTQFSEEFARFICNTEENGDNRKGKNAKESFVEDDEDLPDSVLSLTEKETVEKASEDIPDDLQGQTDLDYSITENISSQDEQIEEPELHSRVVIEDKNAESISVEKVSEESTKELENMKKQVEEDNGSRVEVEDKIEESSLRKIDDKKDIVTASAAPGLDTNKETISRNEDEHLDRSEFYALAESSDIADDFIGSDVTAQENALIEERHLDVKERDYDQTEMVEMDTS